MTTQSGKLPASVAVDAHALPAHEGISITSGSATAGISSAAPVNKEERIFAIDMLRGFALLGILILNIVEFGRAAVFGYCAALLLLLKSGRWRGLTSRLAAVGQMAFSNYILTSLICAIIFDGYGFGYFGRLQRWQLYPIMLSIWILQLEGSRVWLRHFRFGPLEWCWRSLTYCKAQPMRL